jgi:excinuclease ABC subunit C
MYRKFNIKTIEGQNDFGSMEEVVYRRYKRLLDESQDMPDLIIIDGGKGQLSSAVKSLKELSLLNRIPILGIAKRLEELYYPQDPVPLYLNKKSETLKIIQQIRNEAHRFGLGFHRDRRSKFSLESQLDNIKGIGAISKDKLMKRFKSFERIQNAETQELIDEIGKDKAKLILKFLKRN